MVGGLEIPKFAPPLPILSVQNQCRIWGKIIYAPLFGALSGSTCRVHRPVRGLRFTDDVPSVDACNFCPRLSRGNFCPQNPPGDICSRRGLLTVSPPGGCRRVNPDVAEHRWHPPTDGIIRRAPGGRVRASGRSVQNFIALICYSIGISSTCSSAHPPTRTRTRIVPAVRAACRRIRAVPK